MLQQRLIAVIDGDKLNEQFKGKSFDDEIVRFVKLHDRVKQFFVVKQDELLIAEGCIFIKMVKCLK